MDPAFRATAADTIRLVLTAYFGGDPVPFAVHDIYIPGDYPSDVASLRAVQAIIDSSPARFPSGNESVSIGREVAGIADRLVSEVKRRTGRGQKLVGFESDLGYPNLVRAVFSGGGPVPVPPDMKAEMAEMARAGVSVFDISNPRVPGVDALMTIAGRDRAKAEQIRDLLLEWSRLDWPQREKRASSTLRKIADLMPDGENVHSFRKGDRSVLYVNVADSYRPTIAIMDAHYGPIRLTSFGDIVESGGR